MGTRQESFESGFTLGRAYQEVLGFVLIQTCTDRLLPRLNPI